MEDLRDQMFVQKRLKARFICYGASSVLFLAALSCGLLFRNYGLSLDAKASSLSDLNTSVAREQATLKDMNSILREVNAVLPRAVSNEPPSKYLYEGLDAIKSNLAKSQLSMGTIETRGGEVVMPVTVTGPLRDYTAFVQALARLQDMRFPFFTVTALAIKTDKPEKGPVQVNYELRGVIHAPELNGKWEDGEAQLQGGNAK